MVKKCVYIYQEYVYNLGLG